jgi:SAM-dependent methyltransferase
LPPLDREHPAYAGQSAYRRSFLAVYDAIVYGFNAPVLWRCPRDRFVSLYDDNVSGRHLDIGVATGKLLDECRFPVPSPELTLMDLNSNSLEFAARRLARYAPRTHRGDVLEPWGLEPHQFDSVGLTNVLHCLPGNLTRKAVAFDHANAVLAPGGIVFGATILGEGVGHPPLARLALMASNRRGVLSNLDDGLTDLEAQLAARFPSYGVELVGAVAFFTAAAAG